jgi:hypothetical protein
MYFIIAAYLAAIMASIYRMSRYSPHFVLGIMAAFAAYWPAPSPVICTIAHEGVGGGVTNKNSRFSGGLV